MSKCAIKECEALYVCPSEWMTSQSAYNIECKL